MNKKNNEKRKICCVFNYNPQYRFPIYNKMAEEFDCDFFFGDSVFQPLKQFDATKLKGFKGFLKAKKTKFKGHVWHSNISNIFNKEYTHFILTGSPAYIVNWLIILYAFFTGKKVYLWTHGEKCIIEKFFSRMYLKCFYKSVTGIFMYNKYNCQYMELLGCKKEKLHIIHNSLDTNLQSRLYNTLKPTDIYKKHFGNDNPTIIYIGRIQKVKKIEQILDAMKILDDNGKKINLVIVGANVDNNFIENEIDKNRLTDRVWLYGPCFDENINSELIYNADVCVSPGNIGLTCIHVLSYGTPVITNDNFNTQMPEFEAVIDGGTGTFFKEGNTHDLANKIDIWVSKTEDEKAKCREIARKTIIDSWSVDYQIKLLSQVLA